MIKHLTVISFQLFPTGSTSVSMGDAKTVKEVPTIPETHWDTGEIIVAKLIVRQ